MRFNMLPTLMLVMLLTLTHSFHLGPGLASAEPLDDVQAARKELDKIDKLIDTEQWDKIRTILNSPPLAFTGPGSISSTMRDARKTLPKNMQGAAKGISEEFLTTTRLLDSFVYSNVFIDEGRKVLGTKTDFKTPKGYLKDSKRALNEYLELFG